MAVVCGSDAADCVAAVVALANGEAAARTRSAATFATIAKLAEHYPGDPEVVIAALLNRVSLRPGECLYYRPACCTPTCAASASS